MKKVISLLLTVLVLLGCFSGCAPQKAETPHTVAAPELLSQTKYLFEMQPLAEEVTANDSFFSGDYFYYLSHDDEDAISLHTVDSRSGAASAVAEYAPLPLENAEFAFYTEFCGFFPGEDGTVWVVERFVEYSLTAPAWLRLTRENYSRYYTENSAYYQLRQLDATGHSTDLLAVQEDLLDFSLGLELNDHLYLSGQNHVLVYYLKEDLLSSFYPGGEILALVPYRQNAAAVTEEEDGRITLHPLNAEENTMDSIPLPFTRSAVGRSWSGKDTLLYYSCQGSVFSCDGATAQVRKVADWLDYDLNPTNILYSHVLADGTVLAIYQTDSRLLLLRLSPSGTLENTEPLTLGLFSHDVSAMDLAIAYNMEHPESRVRVVNYGEYAAFGLNAQVMFHRQVSAGAAPDMIFSASRDLPVTELAQGYLEDLDPFLEADRALQAEGIIQGVLNVQRSEGKLLSIAPNFGLSTALSTTSLVGTGSLTITRAINLFALYGTDASSVQEQFLKQETVLREHIARNSLLYSDGFNNPSYQEGLLYTAQFPRVVDLNQYGYSGSIPGWARVRTGAQLFLSGTYYGFSTLSQDLYAVGEGALLCGYPDVKGGHVLELWQTYGMFASCQRKDEAWDFLRTALLADSQSVAAGLGFPANLKAFQQAADTAMHLEGTRTLRYGDVTLTIPALLAQSQYNAILAAAQKATARYHSDADLFAAVWPEAQKYLSGQQDLSSTAASTQSAAENYRDPEYRS